MIYANSFSIAATSYAELFTELSISPFDCEVVLQLSGNVAPKLYLAQSLTGPNGPALASDGLWNSTATGNNYYSDVATFRFCTTSDPVYLYASAAVTVSVALIPR